MRRRRLMLRLPMLHHPTNQQSAPPTVWHRRRRRTELLQRRRMLRRLTSRPTLLHSMLPQPRPTPRHRPPRTSQRQLTQRRQPMLSHSSSMFCHSSIPSYLHRRPRTYRRHSMRSKHIYSHREAPLSLLQHQWPASQHRQALAASTPQDSSARHQPLRCTSSQRQPSTCSRLRKHSSQMPCRTRAASSSLAATQAWDTGMPWWMILPVHQLLGQLLRLRSLLPRPLLRSPRRSRHVAELTGPARERRKCGLDWGNVFHRVCTSSQCRGVFLM